MKLPRGAPGHTTTAPTATARWATAAEILRHRYRGDGDLLCGYLPVPTANAALVIERLHTFEQTLLADTALAPSWKEARIAEAHTHAMMLATTALVPIGIDDDRHLVTEAGSRAGKGTSCIIPNLLMYPGSVIVIDPKGENARITAARRGPGSVHCDGMGQTVCVLDPYNTSGVDAAIRGAWNPLDILKAEDDEIIDRAASIASALIVVTKSEDAHWDESARIFVQALILYVALEHAGRDTRNLLTVLDLLTRGARDQLAANRGGPPEQNDPDPFRYLLALMADDDRLDGFIAGAATTLLDMSEKELGSVLSTARRNFEWLSRPAMRRVVRHSTIKLAQLKEDKNGVSLYLCLPPHRMADCGRWLRLVIASALEQTYASSDPPATGHPILFLLEEFPTLKHMEIIETAAGYAAGFGVKLWIITQDLAQLKRWYKDGWETFVGNAGVLQAFSNSDFTTLEYLSKRLGEIEVSQSVMNTTTSLSASSNDPGEFQRMANLVQNRGQISILTNPLLALFNSQSTGQSASTTSAINQQIQRTRLMQPDEIERHFRREAMTQIVSIKGEHPYVLARANYYDSPEFLGLFDPDRDPRWTKEEAARERTRLIQKREALAATRIAEAEAFIKRATQAIEAAKKARK
jgi:type IV secretion system protein VirD4